MKRGARRLVLPLLALGALTLGAGGLSACGWRSDVAASVDGTDIDTSNLQQDTQQLLRQADFANLYLNGATGGTSTDERLPTAALTVLLNRRISEVLVQRELAARGITVTDDDLKSAEADLLDQLDQQDAQAQATGGSEVKASFSQLPDALRNRLIRAEASATALRDDLATSDLASFPADAQAYYRANPDLFAQFCVSTIPVDSEDEGKELIRQTAGGTTLAELVTRQKGQAEGCLAGYELDGLPAQLAGDLRAAAPGAVVGPVQGQSGYLLVGLTSRDVPAYDQVKDQASARYRVARAQAEDPAWKAWLATQKPDVTVDPRYGTWNASQLQVDPPTSPRSN